MNPLLKNASSDNDYPNISKLLQLVYRRKISIFLRLEENLLSKEIGSRKASLIFLIHSILSFFLPNMSSRYKTILLPFSLQYLTNGLIHLVYMYGPLERPNDNTVKQ